MSEMDLMIVMEIIAYEANHANPGHEESYNKGFRAGLNEAYLILRAMRDEKKF